MSEQIASIPAAGPSRCVPRTGTAVPLDTVASPGAYVCNWSGHLLRVPQRGLTTGGELALNMVGGQPLTVTKISEDPDLPLAQARGLAWSLGLSVGF
jgi:hypothetical protein